MTHHETDAGAAFPAAVVSSAAAVELGAGDRLLVIAAHPDDECLAASGLLQRAVAAGAEIAIVCVTDGENNPWAQRAHERRLLFDMTDRARFGLCRRAETLAGLERLGVASHAVHFLALPDQGLTRLLIGAADHARQALAPHLLAWRPTLVVAPSASDLHPDHSALAVLVRLVLGGASSSPPPSELAYLVHNPAARRRALPRAEVRLDADQIARKQAAIACHASQMHWRGRWLRSFATSRETFYAAPWPGDADHPVAPTGASGTEVTVVIRSRPRLRAFGARTLWLLVDHGDAVACLRVALPLTPGRRPVTQASLARPVAHADYTGGPWRGELRLPVHLLAGARRVFLKLERRFGFFDEAGWREYALPPAQAIADRR